MLAYLDSVTSQISPDGLHISFVLQVPDVYRLFPCGSQQSSLLPFDIFVIDPSSKSDTRRRWVDLSIETKVTLW
jgi:hypothetical protein